MSSFGILIQNVFADSTITTIYVGTRPVGVGVNPNTDMIYVTNHDSNTVSVIDGSTNAVVKTIPIGYSLVAVNPVTNEIYVDDSDSNVAVIDGSTNNITATIQIPVGGGAVNVNTNKIYEASCCGKSIVSVIDGSTNAVTSISVEMSLSGSIAVNPNTNMIYASTVCVGCGKNTSVLVIDGATNNVVSKIAIPFVWQSLGVNPVTNKIYAASGNDVYVIDGSTNQITTTISGVIGGKPAIAVNSNTNMIYVADSKNNVVNIIDGKTNSVVNKITVGTSPFDISVNQNTNKIYVANSGDNTVSVIDSNTSNTAPSAPQNLVANAIAPSQISLAWTAPSDNGGLPITGYMIERSIDNGSTWSTIVTNTDNAGTTYLDTGLVHSTTYTYRASAINGIGTSFPSNVASAITLNTVPTPPTGLVATVTSSSQINLKWNLPSDDGGMTITGYAVERSTDGGNTWSTIVSNTSNADTTYSDTGLSPNTTYTYTVSAINGVGTSSPSNTASSTTPVLSVAGVNVGPIIKPSLP
ncbi:MAG TPA: fibronectin type III domain-containing protein [Candidatus Nitrosotalea sp.]|nr:fibronectin type III domain-containing protein [Candidatus Nitrosotalea sp.]